MNRPGEPAGPAARADERARMVERQLAGRGVRDANVLAAMRVVPRHCFVPPELAERAYDDSALPVAEGQTVSQPWVVARMLELAEIAAGDRVLDVGTGTGYQAAVLAAMGAEVFSIERIASLASAAGERLVALGFARVRVRVGDGSLGWQEFAPYARVLAAAAAPHVPRALLEQLGDGGVLVIPVGSARSQCLEVWRRRRNGFLHERYDACRFVPLIGLDAWREDPHHN